MIKQNTIEEEPNLYINTNFTIFNINLLIISILIKIKN